MFSALSQGSSIYLLDKTSSPKFLIGEIIGITLPKYTFNSSTVDIKVKIGDDVLDFNNLPSINSIVTYNNGKIIISETKQGIQNEVEGLLTSSQNILNNIDTYKLNISNCEEILKQLNPRFAKDKELDDRLLNLEDKFGGFSSKLDEIYNFIKK